MLNIRLPIPRLFTPNEIYMSPGAIGVLKVLPASRLFVLTSKSFMQHEKSFSSVTKALQSHVTFFSEKPSGEPSFQMLMDLLPEVMSFRPDYILAIGGGSVLDCAKLLFAYYEHPDLSDACLRRPFGLPPLKGKAKFIAVPTTMGTGSEVSTAAILAMNHQEKLAVVSHDFLPEMVILDPILTLPVPLPVLAESAMDALSHAVEGFVSRYAHPFLDGQAILAIQKIFSRLPQLVTDSANLEVRLDLQLAALMAGWVQNYKIPGIGHAFAHAASAVGYTHGLACSLFLPVSVLLNSMDRTLQDLYHKLAVAVGFQSAADFLTAYRALRATTGVNARLAKHATDWMQSEATRIQLTQLVLQDVCFKANPVTLDATALEKGFHLIEKELALV